MYLESPNLGERTGDRRAVRRRRPVDAGGSAAGAAAVAELLRGDAVFGLTLKDRLKLGGQAGESCGDPADGFEGAGQACDSAGAARKEIGAQVRQVLASANRNVAASA